MADNTTEYLLVAREKVNEALIRRNKGEDVRDLIMKASKELEKAYDIQNKIHKL